MLRKICLLLVIFQLCLFSAYARDYNPLSKFARGLVNVSLGWLEIPRQMIKVRGAEDHKLSGEIAGAFWGPLKGLSYFVGRMAIGTYEVATFVIPTYKPLITPEYIFDDNNDE